MAEVQKTMRDCEPLAGPRVVPGTSERFPWGPVVKRHDIGDIVIIEYLNDMSNTSCSRD